MGGFVWVTREGSPGFQRLVPVGPALGEVPSIFLRPRNRARVRSPCLSQPGWPGLFPAGWSRAQAGAVCYGPGAARATGRCSENV